MRKVFLSVLVLFCAVAGLAQQKKILVTGVGADQIAELRQAAPQAEIVRVEQDDLLREVVDADAIIGTISAELVRAGKKLKWVQVRSAGVERYLHLAPPDLRDSPIVLTNAQIIQGPEIADHAFALLLSITRGLTRLLPHQQDGK